MIDWLFSELLLFSWQSWVSFDVSRLNESFFNKVTDKRELFFGEGEEKVFRDEAEDEFSGKDSSWLESGDWLLSCDGADSVRFTGLLKISVEEIAEVLSLLGSEVNFCVG